MHVLKLGSVMLFRNTFCYTGWNGLSILRVVNTLCIQKKEPKKIRPLCRLQDCDKVDQSLLFGWIARIGQMPSCPSCPSHLCACASYVSLIPEVFSTLFQKYGVAREDVHLVTMAEKMQRALLVTAHPAKKASKRKPEAEKAATK